MVGFSHLALLEHWPEPQRVSMLSLGLTALLQQVGGHRLYNNNRFKKISEVEMHTKFCG